MSAAATPGEAPPASSSPASSSGSAEKQPQDQPAAGAPAWRGIGEASTEEDVWTYGTLVPAQHAALELILARPVAVKSNIPSCAGEGDFPTLAVVPRTLLASVLRELDRDKLGDAALFVSGSSVRACLRPGVEAAEETAADGPDAHAVAAAAPLEVEVWVQFRTSCNRETLGQTRDIFIRCLRGLVPGGCDDDDVPDHLLAGAYIRQMTMVQSPELGPHAHSAIFAVASAGDVPDTVAFRFCGSEAQDGSLEGVLCDTLGFPAAEVDMLLDLTRSSFADLGVGSGTSGAPTPASAVDEPASGAELVCSGPRSNAAAAEAEFAEVAGALSVQPGLAGAGAPAPGPCAVRFRARGRLPHMPGCQTVVVAGNDDKADVFSQLQESLSAAVQAVSGCLAGIACFRKAPRSSEPSVSVGQARD